MEWMVQLQRGQPKMWWTFVDRRHATAIPPLLKLQSVTPFSYLPFLLVNLPCPVPVMHSTKAKFAKLAFMAHGGLANVIACFFECAQRLLSQTQRSILLRSHSSGCTLLKGRKHSPTHEIASLCCQEDHVLASVLWCIPLTSPRQSCPVVFG